MFCTFHSLQGDPGMKGVVGDPGSLGEAGAIVRCSPETPPPHALYYNSMHLPSRLQCNSFTLGV